MPPTSTVTNSLPSSSPSLSSPSSTPRTSSPLNPGSMPAPAPIVLPEDEGDQVDFPDFSGRTRGITASSRKKPLQSSSPVVKVTSSPASTVTPLPGQQENRLHSFFQRSRSKSPSGRINDSVWRKKVNDVETPPSNQGQGASPSASWWGERRANAMSWEDSPRRRKTMSAEEEKAWVHTKERVSVAISSVLGTTLDVAHEVLEIGSDFLELAPIPGLSIAAKTLLQIWDALENVDLNTQSCLRLTERCAETLIAVQQEVHDAGPSVIEELQTPMYQLQEAFDGVRRLLVKEASRPFIKRYLKRDDILRDIAACDADVRAALDMFNLSVSIRILKQTQESERKRQAETHAMLTVMLSQKQPLSPENALMLTGMTQEVTASPPQSPQNMVSKGPAASSVSPSQMSAEQLRAKIADLQLLQNNNDCVKDTENLRQLMHLALQATSDADVLDLLQIKRQDMPEAIKTLQRALERVVERQREPNESPVVPTKISGSKSPPLLRRFSSKRDDGTRAGSPTVQTLDSSSSSGSVRMVGKRDTLEREFLESGIEALLRMSRGVETNLPGWTITKYEVDRDQKIGIGFFSDVYKGTWRGRTVAIKVLADTTPRELFRREVAIWKTLKHPNVLELYGASSTTGDPPWFFVSPYEKNGSLNVFLKRMQNQARSSGSSPGSGRNVLFPAGALPGLQGLGKVDRQATFPIWSGINASPFTLPRAKSPLLDADYRKSRDLHRFIYEIAKGMEYLHSQAVHHGDLKAANVLVDNNLHCVISDFGQSEMKSEAVSLSGATPPHGTLRWQAPELMRGSSHLTKEMDVYSYAICCVEVLTWGNLPWAYTDDIAIRHLVLDDDQRPPLTLTKYTTPALQDLVRECWDRDAAKRPSFSHIVPRMKNIRKIAGDLIDDLSSPRISEAPEPEEEVHVRPSPDMRPPPLPLGDLVPLPQDRFEETDNFTDRNPHKENSVPTPDIKFPEPVLFTHMDSRQSSLPFTPSSEESEGSDIHVAPSRNSPRSPQVQADIVAQTKNERRYRMILTHGYHPSLVLPLWDPSPVDLGAVGYLSKPRGAFVTLFNAFHPNRSSLEAVRAIPSIDGYGRVTNGSQRVSKRNNFFIDTFMGLLTPKNKDDGGIPQAVSRRYTFPLKAGHKAAILCAETTEYRYMISEEGEQLDAPKQWFKANVDAILKIYGAQHQIQREELSLVVGTLRAPNYALFVSHHHPEGHAHFNVFASPKEGRPWGKFTTDSEYEGEGPPVDAPAESSRQSASKVSARGGTQWDTILLARLRFPPDTSTPTTL